jgi:hypothetical protein
MLLCQKIGDQTQSGVMTCIVTLNLTRSTQDNLLERNVFSGVGNNNNHILHKWTAVGKSGWTPILCAQFNSQMVTSLRKNLMVVSVTLLTCLEMWLTFRGEKPTRSWTILDRVLFINSMHLILVKQQCLAKDWIQQIGENQKLAWRWSKPFKFQRFLGVQIIKMRLKLPFSINLCLTYMIDIKERHLEKISRKSLNQIKLYKTQPLQTRPEMHLKNSLSRHNHL